MSYRLVLPTPNRPGSCARGAIVLFLQRVNAQVNHSCAQVNHACGQPVAYLGVAEPQPAMEEIKATHDRTVGHRPFNARHTIHVRMFLEPRPMEHSKAKCKHYGPGVAFFSSIAGLLRRLVASPASTVDANQLYGPVCVIPYCLPYRQCRHESTLRSPILQFHIEIPIEKLEKRGTVGTNQLYDSVCVI